MTRMPTCRYCHDTIAPRTGHRPDRITGGTAWRPKWECLVRGVELIPVGSVCPWCGADIHAESTAQLPLLRHAGHGAVESRTRRWCDRCGWRGARVVATVNPRWTGGNG